MTPTSKKKIEIARPISASTPIKVKPPSLDQKIPTITSIADASQVNIASNTAVKAVIKELVIRDTSYFFYYIEREPTMRLSLIS